MKCSLLFLGLVFPALIYAQSTEVNAIRAHYAKVQAAIKKAPEAEREGSMYCHRIQENVYSASWRAVGQYQKTVEFWSNDEPGYMCEQEEANEACRLQFITEEANISYGGWHLEFLFKDGVLKFAFIAHEGGEFRYYWDDSGKLFRLQVDQSILDPTSKEYQDGVADIWKQGMAFRDKYIALF